MVGIGLHLIVHLIGAGIDALRNCRQRCGTGSTLIEHDVSRRSRGTVDNRPNGHEGLCLTVVSAVIGRDVGHGGCRSIDDQLTCFVLDGVVSR